MPATPVWLAAVESVLNRTIGRSRRAQAAAMRLDRTALGVDIEGLARIRIAVCAGLVALSSGGDLDADAAISGSPFALIRLIADDGGADRGQGRGARAPGGASAKISGDAEIAARYRELFALARPDLEEELSGLIGDAAARRLTLLARGAFGWVRGAGRTAARNLAEYLQEESRDLASRPEVDEFVQGVDRLRDTAERVEIRLTRLEQRLKDAP